MRLVEALTTPTVTAGMLVTSLLALAANQTFAGIHYLVSTGKKAKEVEARLVPILKLECPPIHWPVRRRARRGNPRLPKPRTAIKAHHVLLDVYPTRGEIADVVPLPVCDRPDRIGRAVGHVLVHEMHVAAAARASSEERIRKTDSVEFAGRSGINRHDLRV